MSYKSTTLGPSYRNIFLASSVISLNISSKLMASPIAGGGNTSSFITTTVFRLCFFLALYPMNADITML